MEFICIDLATGAHIGNCTLPTGRYDAYGTEHMFGDNQYVLQSTHVDQNKGVMYFSSKK